MEKILKELEGIKNNRGFAEAIGSYIAEKCRVDEKFTKRVMMKEKEFEQCLRYILTEVKKASEGSSMVAASDDEVFKLVDDYYTKDKAEIVIDEKVVAKAQAPAPVPQTTYAKVDAPEKVEVVKVEKSILTKKEKERDAVVDNQVNLFDLLG